MDKNQAKALGDFIRLRRHELGLSTHELGKVVGTRNSTIMRLEQGAFAAPRPDKLARIAEALEINLADLYARAGYVAPGELPGFHAYLPAKYRELPEAAVTELSKLFEELVARHGIDISPRASDALTDVAGEAG